MHTVAIREAKARLNALVDAAERGETVVLMRGFRLVAAIVAVSSDDLELAPRLTDPRAERLWKRIEGERASGTSVVFDAPEKAVACLASPARRAASRRKTAPRDERAARRGR